MVVRSIKDSIGLEKGTVIEKGRTFDVYHIENGWYVFKEYIDEYYEAGDFEILKQEKVRYIGKTTKAEDLIYGHIYVRLGEDSVTGDFKVVDESGDDYCYNPKSFEKLDGN